MARKFQRCIERIFPIIRKWKGKVTFYILDDRITREEFEYALRWAGSRVGIGRCRPEVGGPYGRFEVKKIEWKED